MRCPSTSSSKCNRIEIHTLTAEGLKGVADVPLFGRIAAMELFRPAREPRDLLLVLTTSYKLSILEYGEGGELLTRGHGETSLCHRCRCALGPTANLPPPLHLSRVDPGDVRDKIGRPAEAGMLAVVDPDCRMIALHLYDGLLKVIPVDGEGQLLDAFNIRLEELMVKDIKFLYGCARPTFAILYEDARELRHVKTYEVNLKEKDLAEGPWQQSNVDMGANLIIPIPAPLGGAVVVGETILSYLNTGRNQVAIPMPQPTVKRAYGRVDADGTRHLLSDHLGRLYILGISHDQSGRSVAGLRVEAIGQCSPAECLAYLDSGVVYIGSSSADSQLVRIHPEAVGDDPSSFVEVLETFVHIGPIVDFAIVDLERQGQGQVVTCSGVHKHGSLRIIRNGIGINEQASIELEGIKGIWSLRRWATGCVGS